MVDTFYKDHWIEIEPERFERYKQMFAWSDDDRRYFDPANIGTGETVVEIGCGPGFTACEISNWVGPSGRVDGVDVNAEFIQFGQAMINENGLEGFVGFHQVSDSSLPFSDQYADCVVAKNVFIYVDDPVESYRECHRVLKAGGRVHVVEGDWGLLVAEPVPEKIWRNFIDAASIAFRTPTIGRKLFGYAKDAGFSDVSISCITNIDTSGRYLPMVRNLCSYARQSKKLDDKTIDSVLSTCEEAANNSELLMFSPQFLVTATK